MIIFCTSVVQLGFAAIPSKGNSQSWSQLLFSRPYFKTNAPSPAQILYMIIWLPDQGPLLLIRKAMPSFPLILATSPEHRSKLLRWPRMRRTIPLNHTLQRFPLILVCKKLPVHLDDKCRIEDGGRRCRVAQRNAAKIEHELAYSAFDFSPRGTRLRVSMKVSDHISRISGTHT